MDNTNNAQAAAMDRAGELPMERRQVERRVAPPVQQPDDVRELEISEDDYLCVAEAHRVTVGLVKAIFGEYVAFMKRSGEWSAIATTRPGAALTPLPPLPRSFMLVGRDLDGLNTLYSAQQMHAYAQIYARAILAASGGAEPVASNLLTFSGRVIEVGDIDDGRRPGFCMDRGNGAYISFVGLTQDEARNVADHYDKPVTISVSAAPATPSQQGEGSGK